MKHLRNRLSVNYKFPTTLTIEEKEMFLKHKLKVYGVKPSHM